MNLIEAWKTNPKGRWTYEGVTINLSSYESFVALTRGIYRDEYLLADDWEIVKEKKKVVIEDAEFFKSICNGDLTLETCQKIRKTNVPYNKPIKMTLEWEE